MNHVRPNQVRTFGNTVIIRINGLPTITLKPSRPLPPGKPSALRIVRRVCGCTVYLVYKEEPALLPATGKTVGGDVGVRKRLTLSTGETMTPDAEDWKAIRRAQRAIARCDRGSSTRRKRIAVLVRLRHRAAVVRRNSSHRMTSSLIARFDVITVEDLRILNMTKSATGIVEAPGRNVKAKSGLNRSILQQAWGQIVAQLIYKAAWAGRWLVKVNAAYTSQDCSVCGERRSKPDAREKWCCEHCDTVHDRDVNGAVNVDRAGILALGSLSGERVAA